MPHLAASGESAAKVFDSFAFSEQLKAVARTAVAEVREAWLRRDEDAMLVSTKVVAAFERAGLNESHLSGSTGYGYGDSARSSYEGLIADLMHEPAALARLQLASGTHAIIATLRALLRDGDRLCAVTGRPYDTLRMALTDHPQGLCAGRIRYEECAWPFQPALRPQVLEGALKRCPAIVFVQRSRGYAVRPSLSVAQIGELVTCVRKASPQSIVLVDNCYGELVEAQEPGDAGADIVIGSLVKNLGGGIAPTGAYIAASPALIGRIADGIFAPGLGTAVGATLDTMRSCFAGLHRAPKAVAESLKIMDFAAALFARLGYEVDPQPGALRTDIIQAIRLGSRAKVEAFAGGLQRWLPVNSRARPQPGPVPGYADPVIMASGSFISGSTLELSCDAPLRAPYEVYLQGGMDLAHGMIATMSAACAVTGDT